MALDETAAAFLETRATLPATGVALCITQVALDATLAEKQA